ncbi:ABC-type phosphate transport system permease subunit, partial [Rhizobium sp. SLBN-94]|nr:ABC-type phosphate transport system permease subunit [Rhizobium sp. SLBN-94]
MTDIVSPAAGANAANRATRRDIGIKRRYAAERRFRAYGMAAISFGLIFLFLLLFSVVSKGYTAFQQTMITVPVEFSEQIIDPKNERATNPAKLMTANYPVVARDAVAKVLGVAPTDRAGLRAVNLLISDSVRTQLRDIVVADPAVIGTTRTVTLLASGDVDSAFKGQVDMTADE